MKREPIDLHYVKPEHMAVHGRLVNWGLWSRTKTKDGVIRPQPIWRFYTEYGITPRELVAPTVVNPLDAVQVQKVLHLMPFRELTAIGWAYSYPYASDKKICWKLKTNRPGVMELIHRGRAMMKNLLRVT